MSFSIHPQVALDSLRAFIKPEALYTMRQVSKFLALNYTHTVRIVRKHVNDQVQEVQDGRGYVGYHLLVTGRGVLTLAERRAKKAKPGTGARAIARSLNAKLGHAAITMAARQSCPDSCPFKGHGCYGEHDNNRQAWDYLSYGAMAASPLEVARAEAAAIDELPADRDLRLHVVGDSQTVEGTFLLAEAVNRYKARAALADRAWVKVWAYTHAWRTVPRQAWGSISVLASCETPAQVAEARELGYATELTVDTHLQDKTYDQDGVRLLPCPNQTRGLSCTDCRLCFDDNRLRSRGLTIAFALHGAGSRKAAEAIGKPRARAKRQYTRRALPMAA